MHFLIVRFQFHAYMHVESYLKIRHLLLSVALPELSPEVERNLPFNTRIARTYIMSQDKGKDLVDVAICISLFTDRQKAHECRKATDGIRCK